MHKYKKPVVYKIYKILEEIWTFKFQCKREKGP